LYVEKDKEKKIKHIRLVKGLKNINFILLIICIVMNGLITIFMLYNFNMGVIFFILNMYNMFILLFKYWRERKNVKSIN